VIPVRPERDDRRVQTHRPDERPEPEPAPVAPLPTALLALQRTAGNAAVGGLLGRAVLARDRRLPEDPQHLEDVAPAAGKDMAVDNDEWDIGKVSDWFQGPPGPTRSGVTVNVHFGGDMATKPDPKVERKLRDGLTGLAEGEFRLQDGTTKPVRSDTVRTRDLDLTGYGGPDGHFRFTCVTRKKNAKGPTEVDVIIELVHAAPPVLQPWRKLDGKRRRDLETRFARPGYTQAQPTLTKVVDTWTDDQFGMVLQALESIPEPLLASVPDIVWERGHGSKGPTGESGWFQFNSQPLERRLILYDNAFKSDDELLGILAHELGHAISSKPQTLKQGGALAHSPEYTKAVQADGGKAVTGYMKSDPDEQFAEAYSLFVTEPETLKAIRPHVYAYMAALK
jgi:hypothetical protein